MTKKPDTAVAAAAAEAADVEAAAAADTGGDVQQEAQGEAGEAAAQDAPLPSDELRNDLAAMGGDSLNSPAPAAPVTSLEDSETIEALRARVAELEKALDVANGEVLAMSDKFAALATGGGGAALDPAKMDDADAAAVDAAIAKQEAEAEAARKKAERDAAKAAKERQAHLDALAEKHRDIVGAGLFADAAICWAFLAAPTEAVLLLSDGTTFHPDFLTPVTSRDVTVQDGALIINAQIDLPVDGDSFCLSSAVLMFRTGVFSACPVGPVNFGGGNAAKLSGGSLIFRFIPVPAVAE